MRAKMDKASFTRETRGASSQTPSTRSIRVDINSVLATLPELHVHLSSFLQQVGGRAVPFIRGPHHRARRAILKTEFRDGLLLSSSKTSGCTYSTTDKCFSVGLRYWPKVTTSTPLARRSAMVLRSSSRVSPRPSMSDVLVRIGEGASTDAALARRNCSRRLCVVRARVADPCLESLDRFHIMSVDV